MFTDNELQQLFAFIQKHQVVKSNNLAEIMNTRSKTAIAASHKPTAYEAIANPPSFKLPREIRDRIYDLVVPSEEKLLYSITLKANERPQKVHSVPRGASHACSAFTMKYQDAVERRVKSLMGEGYRDGLKISHWEPLAEKNTVLVKVSEEDCAAGKGEGYNGPAQKIHAARLILPVFPISPTVHS